VRLTNNTIAGKRPLTPPVTDAADARIAMAVSAKAVNDAWLHAPGLSG